MNRKELLEKLKSLAPSSYEGDFRQHLSSLLEEYCNLITQFDEKGIFADWDSFLAFEKKLTEAIIESVKRIYQGQHSNAYLNLRECLKELKNSTRFLVCLTPKDSLFRMRVFDERSNELPSRKGLFHIPFDKRGIVKTERYSAPGYPCLYLGTSSYVCWEEMGRPNFDKCYVSRFKPNKDIIAFDMSILTEDALYPDNMVASALYRYPLIIASMVQVKDKAAYFKPEYIIPQLLMEWVIEQINSEEERTPIGIYYTTVHKNKTFKYPDFKLNNFALPAQSPFSGKYSKELCDLFEVSEPTCEEIERAKGTTLNPRNMFMPIDDSADEAEKAFYRYKVSTFGLIDRVLLTNEADYPLGKISFDC